MRKWLAFVLAIVVFVAIHEGTHMLVATMYGEYDAFHLRPIGLEVKFKTPVDERSGIQWAFISGASNLLTLSLGYLLLSLGERFAHSRVVLLKAGVYYLTILMLLADALNLSVGPFVYGGDANGIAVGLGISRYVVQVVFFILLLVNRDLLAHKHLPAYNVRTRHPLLRPWIQSTDRAKEG
jgi:hypothetical protein